MKTWNGDQIADQVVNEVVAPTLSDTGLRVERESKLMLYPGHGLITATLKSSIHTAPPSYPWPSDNVPPSAGAPERGGSLTRPEKSGARLTISVGSGMVYAMVIHQGRKDGSFSGYHYLTNALDRVEPEVPAILAFYVKRAGL